MRMLKSALSLLRLYFYLRSYRDGRPISTSLDVTNLCNLQCTHCYYFMKEYQQKQLTDEQWLEKIRWIREEHPTIIHCTWVGGEPMMKRSLLEKAVRIFPFNWIVTNGTYEMPRWDNTAYFVSIDGTEEEHDAIRGKGTYRMIKDRVAESDAENIFMHMVITKSNFQTVPALVREWYGSKVKGIRFSFYTPMVMNGFKDPLYIEAEERDEIIEDILGLKREFRDFILMGRKEIELFLSKNYRRVIDDGQAVQNCLLKKGAVVSIDSNGERKYPCVMGEMDCSRCGCNIPYMLHALVVERDRESMRLVAKTFLN